MKYEFGQVDVRKRNRLPHWHVQSGVQFITFNLFDALPAPVRQRIQEEAAAHRSMILNTRGTLTRAENLAIERWIRDTVGESLDEGYGSAFMRRPEVAAVVAETITHFDERRYSLLAWCVMPNHVHVVADLAADERLDRVVHSWKSYTAKAANRVIGRTGPFWQDDYYNRVVRDDRELARTIEYVLENPAKAGLRDWQFVRAYPERIPPGEAPGDLRAGRPRH